MAASAYEEALMGRHKEVSPAGTSASPNQRTLDSRRGSCSRVRSWVREDRANDVHNSSSVCRRRIGISQTDVSSLSHSEAGLEADFDAQGMSVRSSCARAVPLPLTTKVLLPSIWKLMVSPPAETAVVLAETMSE